MFDAVYPYPSPAKAWGGWPAEGRVGWGLLDEISGFGTR
jgi:hypothetical protein